ncbi:hypothetical protein AB0B89_27680 [Sphaerisporangium sp. NPDC049002]|uniref:hypothetical protein n=1 Tax=unclassified Sphaerisporangium TaxID=2630420 RepID=UPI0033DD517C
MTDDEYVLAALRIAAGADPVPARVSTDARAVYGLRLPGALTAGPVGVPSGVQQPSGLQQPSGVRPPSGVRSGGRPADGEPRLLRFAAGGVTIDVEITICDSHIDLAGQVQPAPGKGARVEIRTPHVSKIRFPSETGEFATTGLPHGWLSVVCHRPGNPPIATRWQCVRL